MTKKLFFKTIALWFLLAILAIVNGLVRNYLYKPMVGDLIAHQISTLIFILVIFIVTYFSFKKNYYSNKLLLLVGLIWVGLTEAFEFLAGHYLFGNSWEKLLADYNIFNRRIWIFVLIATMFAPYLINKFFNNKKLSK